MTASNVTQVNLYPNVTAGTGQVRSNPTDDFPKIFATQSAQNEDNARMNPKTEETETGSETIEEPVEEKKENSVENTQETVEEKQEVSETSESEESGLKDGDETDTEKMMEAVSEMMATIQKVLGVSEEEIQSALEELGISAEELLDTGNIPKLVIALTEGADELSVMTNEEMFANVQELTAKAQELSGKLNGEGNPIQEAIAEMDPIPEAEAVVKTESVETQEPVRIVATDNKLDVPVLEENRVQVSVEKTDLNRNTGSDTDKTDAGAGNQNQMTFAQTVAEQIEQAVTRTETTYSESTFSVTTENIMNQIQNGIRIIQTQDVTQMELQLNPESLGHVRVELAAKEGVITATFTTENEAVKAALESQMVALKQNFEQQGIKVEAVEVTVASHAFEHNLNGDENDAQQQQAPEKKKGTRRISLTDLLNGIEEEDLSDEDRIVAEMMKENGNTVDYTA